MERSHGTLAVRVTSVVRAVIVRGAWLGGRPGFFLARWPGRSAQSGRPGQRPAARFRVAVSDKAGGRAPAVARVARVSRRSSRRATGAVGMVGIRAEPPVDPRAMVARARAVRSLTRAARRGLDGALGVSGPGDWRARACARAAGLGRDVGRLEVGPSRNTPRPPRPLGFLAGYGTCAGSPRSRHRGPAGGFSGPLAPHGVGVTDQPPRGRRGSVIAPRLWDPDATARPRRWARDGTEDETSSVYGFDRRGQ